MPSRERRSRAPHTDRGDDTPAQAGGTPTLADALEEVARAEARAEAARTRATQLSREAEVTSGDHVDITDGADADDTDGAAVDESVREAGLRSARSSRLRRRPERKTWTVGAALVLISAFLGASGYVVWYHRRATDEQHRVAEFAAAARHGAITLMSMDATKARDDVQRMIDDTTGQLNAAILITEDELVKAAEESKVSTKVAVQAVAVESMTNDSAVVLLATKAEVVNPDPTKPPPRSSRIVMNVQRDGGQLKVSRLEFLP